jgi:poly-gamma-glutamate synthesis protein (capsule biosynthesis protein)
MCHSPQFEYARNAGGEFNFDDNFYYVKNITGKADIAFANFETVLAGKGAKYSGYPTFNTPDSFLDAVKNAGFDFLFTSNNHAYDRGEKGVLKTIEKIKFSGLMGSGTFSSFKDRDSLRIIIVNNIKIGILSYADHINGFKLPKGKEYLVNLIDKDRITKEIKNLKKTGAEIVLVYFHFGDEYKKEPTQYQKTIVKSAIASGADIILASHPHILERLETFKPVNSKLDTGIVAYSLGNFISNQRWRYSDAGVILNLTIEKGMDSNLLLRNVEIIPTWVFKGNILAKKTFAVLPAEMAFEQRPPFFLTGGDIKMMKESFFDCRSVMLNGLRLSSSKINFKNFHPSN